MKLAVLLLHTLVDRRPSYGSFDFGLRDHDISDSFREKYTNKEIKKDYRLEEYLKIVRNPAHRISMTKLRLGSEFILYVYK